MNNSAQEVEAVDPHVASTSETHGTDAGGQPLSAAEGLIRLSRLVQGLFGHISERHDLTPVQAKLLCVLATGPRGMADLARCFGVENAALTGLVDRAERNGLVTRCAVPGDRRALHVSLTEPGRRAANAFHADATEHLDGLVSALGRAEREQFRHAMQTILAATQELTP